MSLISRKPPKKDLREVLNDKKAVERAVKGSIKDQRKISERAAKLRAAHVAS